MICIYKEHLVFGSFPLCCLFCLPSWMMSFCLHWEYFNLYFSTNERARFNKCKQLFQYQHLLFLETSGGRSSNQYLNVVQFFNTSVNKTSVVAKDSCFPPLVSNMCFSIDIFDQFVPLTKRLVSIEALKNSARYTGQNSSGIARALPLVCAPVAFRA